MRYGSHARHCYVGMLATGRPLEFYSSEVELPGTDCTLMRLYCSDKDY
jgi:hypothetical protein